MDLYACICAHGQEVAKEVEKELQEARQVLEGIQRQYEPTWLQQLLSKIPFFNSR